MQKKKTITQNELKKWIESNPVQAIDIYLNFQAIKYNNNKPLRRIILKRLEADFNDKTSIMKLIHGLLERAEKINIKQLSNLYSWSRLFDKRELFLDALDSIIIDDNFLATDILTLQIFYEKKFTEIEQDQKKKVTLNFQESLNKSKIDCLQDQLKNWIYPDQIKQFISIERELFSRNYIDSNHKWKKTKIMLVDFWAVINFYKFFKPFVYGKRIKDFNTRQFISQRYGFKKTGLTETWEKNKPSIKNASNPFLWINEPS